MAELPFESSNYHRPEKLDVVIILILNNNIICFVKGII